MFNSGVLNVVAGLVFIFLLYSLLATIIQEIIATYSGMRARILKRGIARMLDDNKENDAVSRAFYDHPFIRFLGENKFFKKPSYLSAQNFSKVFIDLLRGNKAQPGENTGKQIQQALDSKKISWGTGTIGDDTQKYLQSIWTDARGDVEKFRELLEKWYDDTMERASGWYKRWTQLVLLGIGLVLSISFNIDSITIAKKLNRDPKLAAQLADNASVYIQAHRDLGTILKQNKRDTAMSDPGQVKNADSLWNAMVTKSNLLIDSANILIQDDISSANQILGLGWKSETKDKSGKITTTCNFEWYTIFGWMITALAISLGAPFWFDLLNRMMKLRTAVVSNAQGGNKKQ